MGNYEHFGNEGWGAIIINWSRLPVPGSNLGLGPPHSAACGGTQIALQYCINTELKT